MLKASILDLPRMSKPLDSKFWCPKTSNSKVLTSWGHLSGWLDAKSFDFGWPQDVKTFEFKILGSKNLEFKGFNILGSSVRLAGC